MQEHLLTIFDVLQRLYINHFVGIHIGRGIHNNHLHDFYIRFSNREGFENHVSTTFRKIRCVVGVTSYAERIWYNSRIILNPLVVGDLVFQVYDPFLKFQNCNFHHLFPLDLLVARVPR